MRKIFWRAVPGVVALLLAAGGGSRAEEPAAAELEARIEQGPTQAEFVAYAYRSNPMIASARALWEAAAEKYRVATGLPDPRIMGEGMYMTEEIAGAPADWRVGVTQMIPLPGRLGAEGEVVRAEARAAQFELDRAVRDVTVEVRESFQELLYLQDAKRIAAQNRELVAQLRRVGESAYAQNRALLYDVLKAQAQAGQVEYDVLLLDELERTEKTRMNGLLNRPPEAPIGPVADHPVRLVAYPVEEIYPLAEANREEIKMAEAQAQKAKAMLSAARYMNLPEVELGASFGRDNGAQQVGIQAGLTLPLWPGKRAGRIGQAAAELESARALRLAEQNETRTLVRDTYFRLQNAERLVKLYRDDLVPQAARAMEAAETWHREGQGSFADTLEAQAVWYNFQLSLARARSDHGKFLARLEALAGQPLTEKAAAPAPASAGTEGSR